MLRIVDNDGSARKEADVGLRWMIVSMRESKRRRPVIIAVSALLALVVIVAVSQHSPGDFREPVPSKISPILIQKDQDFDLEHGVIAGLGTASDPYVIEGWAIDTSQGVCAVSPCAGITVRNVSASFIIRNVSIRGGHHDQGIVLTGVGRTRVEGTKIAVGGEGIRVTSSTNLTIVANVVTGSDEAVSLTGTHGVSVAGNNVSKGGQGIVVKDSSQVTLDDNILSDNSANGMILSYVANSTVEGNRITTSAFRAIVLFDSSDIIVSRNRIVGSGEECLYVIYGARNSIIENEMSSCKWAGISVKRSDDNVISENSVAVTPRGIVLSESCGNLIARNHVANATVSILVPSDCNIVMYGNVSGSAVREIDPCAAHSSASDCSYDATSRQEAYVWAIAHLSRLDARRITPVETSVTQPRFSGFLVS